jgi:hypothetical protein
MYVYIPIYDDDLMPPPEYFGVTIESELDAEVRLIDIN